MKKLIYSLLIIASSKMASAQDYIFTHFTEPYVEYNDGTLMNMSEVCNYEDVPTSLSIGFQLPFYNYFLNSLGVHIVFLLSENISEIAGQQILAQFFPYGANFECNSSFGSIRYKTTGVIGSQIFKIQFSDIRIINDSIGNDRCNYQVWMYEESGRIEYRTGPFQISQADGYFTSENGTTTGFVLYDEGNSVIVNSIFLKNSPLNPDAYYDADYDFFVPTLVGHPTNGKVYRFDRPINTLDQLSKESKFSVYPNPANERIQVKGTFYGNLNIELCNSLGQILAHFNQADINLKDFSSGIYYIKVNDSSSTEIIKLVKE
jgi:hypothetical protein